MKITTYILLAVSLLSGCTTYNDEARQAQARESHKRTSMSSDVAMLKERIKGTELAQEQLAQDIMELKQLVAKMSSSNDQLSSKMTRAVKALEARDSQMQKETIQTISVKMAEIMKQQVSAVNVGSGTAVQHVVEQGQTLSAIAQAYGVSVSAIVKANKLRDPNNVRVGEKLLIPR